MLCNFLESQKKTWDNEPEFIKKMYEQIVNSQIYADYIANEENNYEADREFWRKIYRTLIQENEDLAKDHKKV